jgi:hypothetical protein
MGYTKRYRLKDGLEVNVYQIPKSNTGLSHDVTVYGDPPAGSRLPTGTHVGDWFDESAVGAVAMREKPQETAFLYLYGVEEKRSVGAGVRVAAETGTPGRCGISAPLQDWPIDPRDEGPYNHCFYPIAVQHDLGPMENVPLTHSCMCSMLPKQTTTCAIL